LRECPNCGIWMLEFDPRTEKEHCYNCGYEKEITNVKEYYIHHDVTCKLFLWYSGKTVEPEKAFVFYSSSGTSIGEKASSLWELASKVQEVDSQSLEYHLARGDFERWIADVIGDSELAAKIGKLREANHVDYVFRDRLYRTILASSIK